MQHPQNRLRERLNNSLIKHLLRGNVEDFIQAVAPDIPAAAGAASCRAYVIDGPLAVRKQITDTCQVAVGHRAVVANCLTNPTYTVIVALLDAATAAASTGGWDPVGLRLKEIARRRPDCYLAGSGIVNLTDPASAQHSVMAALATARLAPRRIALHNSDVRFAALLDARAAGWAAGFLYPAIRQRDGIEALETVRIALALNVTAAAKVQGTSRTEIYRHMERVSDSIGLDLGVMRDRAALGLALEVHGRSPVDVLPSRVQLADLLATASVRSGSAFLFARLDTDRRSLRRTLAAWMAHNGDCDRAGVELGLKPRTVRDHIEAVEGLLHRRLLPAKRALDLSTAKSAPGSHGVYVAAAACGDIQVAEWPDPTRGLSRRVNGRRQLWT